MGALEDALTDVNQSLPPTVQFTLPSENQHELAKRLLNVDGDEAEFDYTEGFVATVGEYPSYFDIEDTVINSDQQSGENNENEIMKTTLPMAGKYTPAYGTTTQAGII